MRRCLRLYLCALTLSAHSLKAASRKFTTGPACRSSCINAVHTRTVLWQAPDSIEDSGALHAVERVGVALLAAAPVLLEHCRSAARHLISLLARSGSAHYLVRNLWHPPHLPPVFWACQLQLSRHTEWKFGMAHDPRN